MSKKIDQKQKRKGSLYSAFLQVTLLPLLVLGIVIVAFTAYNMTNNLKEEIQNELSGIGSVVLATYDNAYPGDYTLVQNGDVIVLQKGDTVLSGNYDAFDAIKAENDVDISLFISNLRVMTTITDSDGTPFIGTQITSLVTDKVMVTGEEYFFDNVTIGDEPYFCYYRPLFNSDNSCIGMIGIAKSSADVNKLVSRTVFSNVLIVAVAVVLTMLFITYFTRNIVAVIKKNMDFLNKIATGNLDGELDYQVEKRNDELGEMGRLTVRVQSALKKLVEQDVLTGLLNRRSGENKLQLVYSDSKKYGEPFALCISDIDFFKKVNDTYGHDAGDAVLKTVAGILHEAMAGKGYAIRWGGEEFLLLFERMDKQQAADILAGVLDTLHATTVTVGKFDIKVNMTFGLTDGDTGKEMAALIRKADDNLYKGKMNGRNQIVL